MRETSALRDGPQVGTQRRWRAIEYMQLVPEDVGKYTLANALEAMQRDTRRFAKRQRTWLRTVSQAVHVDPQDLAAKNGRAHV